MEKECLGKTSTAVRVLAWVLLSALPLLFRPRLTAAFVTFFVHSDTFSQIPLIPIASGFLLYANRKSIFSKLSSSGTIGSLIIASGFGSLALSSFVGQHYPSNKFTLFAFALFLICNGAFIVSFGLESFWIGMFPLLFLVFAVPIPEPLLSKIISYLQYGSANVAEGFFRIAGVPYLRQDLVFNLPGVSIRVAEECSGIRSTLALLITTVLASYLFLRTSWRRLVLGLAVVPLAIFKNGLRITVLSTLAIYVNPEFLYGNLHHHGGVVFFTAALMVMGLLFHLLQKGEKGMGALPWQRGVASPELAKPLSEA